MTITVLSPEGPGGLSVRPPLPAAILEQGNPQITGHTYHSADGVNCVVWGATPYRIHPKQRPDFEFSILLEGEVVLTDGEGRDHIVRAGDAFVLPAAFTYQWGQRVPVLKYALSFTPSQPAAQGSVFTPFHPSAETCWSADGTPLFREQTGQFSVTGYELEEGNTVELTAEVALIKVLEGAVHAAEEGTETVAIDTGQTAFLSVSGSWALRGAVRSRFIICSVHRQD